MKQVTLLYLRRGDQVLIAMKKRGFGTGKWNGVGGKVEASETPLQAVVRECQEEIGVTPLAPKLVGRLRFCMPEDPNFEHDCFVFVTEKWQGEPRETEEMRPQWFKNSELPYAAMWADDEIWIPIMLGGQLFTGTITVSETELISHTIKPVKTLEEAL